MSSPADIPNQAGKLAVVTGATGGIGFDAALELARAGDKVLLAMGKSKIDFDDLQSERPYSPWNAYCQSKLAMLLFAFELQRRSDANGWSIRSNAAHPSYSRTGLIANGPGANSAMHRFSKVMGRFLSQSSAEGALPILYAATAPEAQPSGYNGPRDRFEMRGPVAKAVIGKAAQNEAAAKRLWEISEQLTGVAWPGSRPAAHRASWSNRRSHNPIPKASWKRKICATW